MAQRNVVRWGILGTGKMARRFASDLALLPGAQITAVGSRAMSTADAFADRHEVPHRYDSYQQLVEDDHVDIVYVATPQTFHARDVRSAFDAGRHVLCEKPFMLNASQAESLISLGRDRNLFVMEALWTRFLPIMEEVRARLAKGVIGAPQWMIADIGAYVPFDPAHRLYDPALGGGALLDLGIYPIQLALDLFGFPDHVASEASIGETGVDEQSSYIFRYDDGRQAILSASTRTNGRREATIAGPEGRITITRPWWKGRSCTVESSDGNETITRNFEGYGYHFEAAHVMECLSKGLTESPVMPLDETLTLASLMDDLRAAWGMRFPSEQHA